MHYFSDSSDDAAEDADDASEDEAVGQGEEVVALMAAVQMGGNATVAAASGGDSASTLGQAAAAVSVGSAQIVGNDAIDAMAASADASAMKPSTSSAPLSQHPEPPQKSAALTLPPPPCSYAPSARMCSSIVMKALLPALSSSEPALTHQAGINSVGIWRHCRKRRSRNHPR